MLNFNQGYGIRYTYGIFQQCIIDGYQTEVCKIVCCRKCSFISFLVSRLLVKFWLVLALFLDEYFF